MWTRRDFIAVSASARGGLLVSLYLDLPTSAQDAPRSAAVTYPPAAFVDIKPDGQIVIQVNRIDIGQGVLTALPLLLADQMDADWSRVVAELPPAADLYPRPLFGMQMVGGSC